jgi:phage shock protein C
MSSPLGTGPRAGPTPRLTRSREDRLIGGVAGGIGHYFEIDPVVIRVVFVVLALVGGGGVLAYLIAWVVIPDAPTKGAAPPEPSGSATSLVAGLLLVGLGSVWLLNHVLPAVSWRPVGPVLLIALGVLLLLRRNTEP